MPDAPNSYAAWEGLLSAGWQKFSGTQWMEFQLGIRPGIHPSRWPSWVPPVSIASLSADPRTVSYVFSRPGGEQLPAPGLYRGEGHPLASVLVEQPDLIPTLHAMTSAAVGLELLSLTISSRHKNSLEALLGHDILAEAVYLLPRLGFPDLSRWFEKLAPDQDPAAVLSARGGRVLMGSLHDTPLEFRRMVLAALPCTAGDRPPVREEGEFLQESFSLVRGCMERIRVKGNAAGMN